MSCQDDFSRAVRRDSLSADFVGEQNRFINRVFGWMTLGLAVTAATSWFVAGHYQHLIVTHRTLYMVLIIAELFLVMGLSGAIRTLSAAAAFGGFILFSVLNGVTLSWLFLVYQMNSIARTFCIASVTFGVTGLYGWCTRKDLTSWGTLLMMGVVGVIVASLVNFFLRSSGLDWFISVAGVLIFVGLTAYDTQKIKQLSLVTAEHGVDEENSRKLAVLGALTLYLDFINLFLYLLRFFGRRK